MIAITPQDYLRPAVAFLKFLPKVIRTCPEDPSLKFYGTGDTGHWAVQCNQQVMAGLAILSESPLVDEMDSPYSRDELRALALSLFRYSVRTHLTGDLTCNDGKKWGRHWISVLGLERAIPGLNVLYPHMTADDRARLRALDLFEADYRLDDYPVEADIVARTGKNKPESNIWNAGFLFRAAANYPDAPNAAAYPEKATRMMLAGLSHPSDAASDELFRGRPLRDWFVGPNFTENWSLDHHNYMNVGYSFVCLSNLALLHFNFRERGQTPPDCLLHHVEDLWKVVKKFVFPDGRLLRIGGDSRARYCYCQDFALQGFTLAADLFGDEDAIRAEAGFLRLMEKEQKGNPDGSFFGSRLVDMTRECPYYYLRLEADPFFAVACGARWRSLFAIPDKAPDAAEEPAYSWSDGFHSAVLRREAGVARSVVRRAEACPVPTRSFYCNVPPKDGCNPSALCVPLGRSDFAEWNGNLFAFIGLRCATLDDKTVFRETTGGFRWETSGDVWESGPIGEGEHPYVAGRRTIVVEALPDGRTMVFADRFVATRECSLALGFRTLHLMIPNDVYNDGRRRWRGRSFDRTTTAVPDRAELVETRERVLNVDDAVSVFAIAGTDLRLYREGGRNILLNNALRSLCADEVCMDCDLGARHCRPGDVVFDVVYAVAANTTRDEALAVPDRAVLAEKDGGRHVVFTGFDGQKYDVDLALAGA